MAPGAAPARRHSASVVAVEPQSSPSLVAVGSTVESPYLQRFCSSPLFDIEQRETAYSMNKITKILLSSYKNWDSTVDSTVDSTGTRLGLDWDSTVGSMRRGAWHACLCCKSSTVCRHFCSLVLVLHRCAFNSVCKMSAAIWQCLSHRMGMTRVIIAVTQHLFQGTVDGQYYAPLSSVHV